MASYATDLPGLGEGHSLLQRDAIVASSSATYGQAWAEEHNLTASSIHPLSSGRSDSGSREEKGCSAAARDAFELFDSDRDGLLNVPEFRKCMAQLGMALPDDEEVRGGRGLEIFVLVHLLGQVACVAHLGGLQGGGRGDDLVVLDGLPHRAAG